MSGIKIRVKEQPKVSFFVGDPVQGIPAGGTTDQVLAKNSDTDYDVDWKTLSEASIPNNSIEKVKLVLSVRQTLDLADNSVQQVAGKGLSDENYTLLEKQKLANIEAGAQVNTVDSVAGKTGAVTLAKADVGLSNVDNTSDADKPVSTLQQAALDLRVPYTGATADVNLGGQKITTESIQLNTTPSTIPTTKGSLYWDVDDNVLAIILNGVTEKVGETTFFAVTNKTGSTIPKGTAVGFAGTVGASGRLLIKPYIADGSEPAIFFMGVTAEAILNDGDGKAFAFGKIRNLNTNAFNEGDVLYVSPSVAGGFTTVKPTLPNLAINVAAVVTKSATVGNLLVRVTILNYDYADLLSKPTIPTQSQIDFISGLIQEVEDGDYKLVVKAPYAGTITETTTICASGTATFTFKINTTSLGGTANSVSSSEQSQTHSSANAFSIGDDIVITASANSACLMASFTIKFTRNLAV